MEPQPSNSVAVLPYVLIVFGVRFVAGALAVAYSLKTGQGSPISATPILIGAVGIAMIRYWKVAARPMSPREILRFSLGNLIIDNLLSVGGALWYMFCVASAFTWDNFKTDFLGVGVNQNVEAIVGFGLVVGSMEAFVVSGLFAWLFSKQFAKRSIREGAAD